MTPMELVAGGFFTEKEVAEMLGYSSRTMPCKRARRKNHPPYLKVGTRILYPKPMFWEWMKKLPIHKEYL